MELPAPPETAERTHDLPLVGAPLGPRLDEPAVREQPAAGPPAALTLGTHHEQHLVELRLAEQHRQGVHHLLQRVRPVQPLGGAPRLHVQHDGPGLHRPAPGDAPQLVQLVQPKMAGHDPHPRADGEQGHGVGAQARIDEHHGRDGEHRARRIDHAQNLAGCEPGPFQLMVHVIGVPLEDRPSSHQPANQCYRRIEHRHPERHDRHGDGHQGGALGRTLHREAGQEEPGQHGARVAQEGPGGREVEREKAQQGTGQRGGHQADAGVAQRHRHDEDGRSREERRSRRHAVGSVQEVERVRDAHQPQHRDRDAHRRTQGGRADGKREQLDSHTQRVHPGGHPQLDQELDRRPQRSHVVHQPQQQNRPRPRHHGPERARLRHEREPRGREHEPDERQSRAARQRDAEPAGPRHRRLPGVVQRSHPPREHVAQGDEHRRRQSGHDEDEKV